MSWSFSVGVWGIVLHGGLSSSAVRVSVWDALCLCHGSVIYGAPHVWFRSQAEAANHCAKIM